MSLSTFSFLLLSCLFAGKITSSKVHISVLNKVDVDSFGPPTAGRNEISLVDDDNGCGLPSSDLVKVEKTSSPPVQNHVPSPKPTEVKPTTAKMEAKPTTAKMVAKPTTTTI